MKKLITILLCTLLLTGCAQSYEGPTETRKVLAEYEVRQFSPVDDSVWTNRSTNVYDIHGNCVQQLHYDDGELESELRWTFDERGNHTRETLIDHTLWIPLIDYRTRTTYDDRDRILSSVMYNMWGLKEGETRYTYDDENRTATWSNGRGDTIVYYYDENGQETRYVSSDGSEMVYEYDERGNLTGWTSTKDGVLLERYEAHYDEQDRWIQGVIYDENGAETSRITYTYDDTNAKAVNKDNDGSRIDYFDEDGDICRSEEYDLDGKLTKIEEYFYRDILVPADGEE